MKRLHIDETSDQDLETLVTIGNPIVTEAEFDRLAFSVSLAGGTAIALDQFVLQVRAGPNTGWKTLIATWTTVITGLLTFKSGTLNLTAHAAEELAVVTLPPVQAIRFQSAQAAATASAVTVVVGGWLLKA